MYIYLHISQVAGKRDVTFYCCKFLQCQLLSELQRWGSDGTGYTLWPHEKYMLVGQNPNWRMCLSNTYVSRRQLRGVPFRMATKMGNVASVDDTPSVDFGRTTFANCRSGNGDGGNVATAYHSGTHNICVRQVSRRKIPGNLQSCVVGVVRVQQDTCRILESVWRTSSHGANQRWTGLFTLHTTGVRQKRIAFNPPITKP